MAQSTQETDFQMAKNPSLEAYKEFCLCVGRQRKALVNAHQISFLIKCLISAKLVLVCAALVLAELFVVSYV